MLVYYIVDLASQFAFLFCILQVTTNLQSSVVKVMVMYLTKMWLNLLMMWLIQPMLCYFVCPLIL